MSPNLELGQNLAAAAIPYAAPPQWTRRLLAAGVALCCASLLGLAAWLTPSPTGIGTHEALNLPPCGWVAIADLPCPTCGMTTAFAHAADGHVIASFQAQPLGALLALAVSMALFVSIHIAMTGSRLERAFTRLWGTRTAWLLAVIVVGAWAYKIISHKGWL